MSPGTLRPSTSTRLNRPFAVLLLLTVGLVIFGVSRSAPSANEEQSKISASKGTSKPIANEKDDTPKELFSGKVVILQDALKRRGVKAFDEFKSQVVLEADDGELIPIVPDWRGRAFYQDERLRERRVDLVGTRKKAAPYLQVLMIFVFDEAGARQYMDYWCDICSIPMYEIKPCDCCQAEIRFRTQPQELPAFAKKKVPQ